MTDMLAPYISESVKTPFRKIRKYRATLPRKQALLDFGQLRYIMDNRYSGKEYWERQGISFADCYEQVRAFIMARDELYISDFCRAIHTAFHVGIVDNHLAFASPMTGRLHFSKKYAAYFADILVEKVGETFRIASSCEQQVKAGSRMDDENCLFPTLSPPGKQYFLVGCRSWSQLDTMQLHVNDAIVTVAVHRCRASVNQKNNDICLSEDSKSGIDIVQSNCCDFILPLTKKTDIVGIGKKHSADQILIWDNLSNEGGYSRIPRDFLQGLNNYVCCEEYSAKLTSPLTKKRPCKRKWEVFDSEIYKPENGSFQGTLYFLMNSDTASSGETSVLYAKSLRHAVFIGENSMGCNTFGNVASYQLKHSGIVLRVPNIINLCRNPDDCVEGKGFTPDYWVDHTDVQAEVIRWLQNPGTYVPKLGNGSVLPIFQDNGD